MENGIGLLVKHYREQRDLTQAELAKGVNCGQTAISKIETGVREITDIKLLTRIAAFFGFSLAQFMEEAEFGKPAPSDGKPASSSQATIVPAHPEQITSPREALTRLLSDQDSKEDRQLVQHDLVGGKLTFTESDTSGINKGDALNLAFSEDDGGINVRIGQLASEKIRNKLFPPPPGVPPPVPSLLFVGRSKDIGVIKRLLGIGAKEYSAVTIVEGWPGVGKTTIAGVLARDPEVLANFPAGVLWTALGQSPNLFSELAKWCRSLGVNAPQNLTTVSDLTAKLHELLLQRRMLLIVDDAWDVGHVTPFLQINASHCGFLITTRQPQVTEGFTNTTVKSYRLPILEEDEGLKLLWALAPDVVERDKKTCRALVRDLERLPLALHVAGRLLRMENKLGWGVSDLIEDIRSGAAILRERAPEDRAEDGKIPTVSALFHKSTDLLDEQTRDYFASLGVFAPKPATFDLAALAAVWREEDPKPYIRKLMAYGLLETAPQGRFQVHALLVAHARSLLQ